MSSRRITRLVLFVLLGLLAVYVVTDVLGLRESETGVRSPTGYVAISHGSHSHYVPNDWDGSDISGFPTSPPPEGMTVGPTGEFVPAE